MVGDLYCIRLEEDHAGEIREIEYYVVASKLESIFAFIESRIANGDDRSLLSAAKLAPVYTILDT
jgi:hypothetical protein